MTIVAIGGLWGNTFSKGMLKAVSEYPDVQWHEWNENALEQYAGQRVVVMCHSFGWREVYNNYRLLDPESIIISLDPARVYFNGETPLVSPAPGRHLNIWQERSVPQPFGPVEGAQNIKWKQLGHSQLDDRLGVHEIIQERVRQFNGDAMTDRFYIGEYNPLSDSDFIAVANEYGLTEAHVRAVVEVESAGKGSHTSGALTALYEPHIAYRYTSGETRLALVQAGLARKTWLRDYPPTSYPRIDRCVEIVSDVRGDAEAGIEIAALSTSWGLGQVMGFNHKACGFDSAADMVRNFAQSEANQLRGMMEFIKSNDLLDHLKNKRWSQFAAGYNGAGHAKNNYVSRLSNAFDRWSQSIRERGDVIVAQPSPEPVLTDLDAFLAAEYPNTEPEARERAAMLADAIAYRLGNLNSTNLIEGNNMAFETTKSLLKSKTIWGLIGAGVAVFVPQLAPIVDIIAPDGSTLPPESIDATKQALESIIDSVSNIVAAASLLFAAYGRKVADKKIG